MKEKNMHLISDHYDPKFNFLTTLVVKSFIVVIVFIGCNRDGERFKKVEYIYNRYIDNNSSKFEKRRYKLSGDTIIEEIAVIDTLMTTLSREKRTLIKSENGLDVMVNGKRTPYLQFDESHCTSFTHPMGFTIRTCFVKRGDYKGYKDVCEYREETMDGVRQTVYLDKDYALIDKISSGVAVYDSLIRVRQRLDR